MATGGEEVVSFLSPEMANRGYLTWQGSVEVPGKGNLWGPPWPLPNILGSWPM